MSMINKKPSISPLLKVYSESLVNKESFNINQVVPCLMSLIFMKLSISRINE